ncbi:MULTISPECIES: hypothetical protein [unclassified Streptomyces]|uniref:hypothetical protein n=1 Tax=unclassified Streptomyces TaxID=2593676 RepID=UPI0004CA2981|nr:hypothetical protein [Streptomyces sp. NRRL F-2747]
MSHRRRLRSVVVGVSTAVLVAGSGLLSLPVQAEGHPATAAASASSAARQTAAERTVDAFFRKYQDAILEQESEGKTPMQVREEYLSKEFDEALDKWSEEHQVDPILRRAETPETYDVNTAGPGDPGNEKVVLTFNWKDGKRNDYAYQVGLTDMIIKGISEATR